MRGRDLARPKRDLKRDLKPRDVTFFSPFPPPFFLLVSSSFLSFFLLCVGVQHIVRRERQVQLKERKKMYPDVVSAT